MGESWGNVRKQGEEWQTPHREKKYPLLAKRRGSGVWKDNRVPFHRKGGAEPQRLLLGKSGNVKRERIGTSCSPGRKREQQAGRLL